MGSRDLVVPDVDMRPGAVVKFEPVSRRAIGRPDFEATELRFKRLVEIGDAPDSQPVQRGFDRITVRVELLRFHRILRETAPSLVRTPLLVALLELVSSFPQLSIAHG